jgi:hypothetical protein
MNLETPNAGNFPGRGPVGVRVIKFRLPGGEMETLITSVVGTKYEMRTFKGLYFLCVYLMGVGPYSRLRGISPTG